MSPLKSELLSVLDSLVKMTVQKTVRVLDQTMLFKLKENESLSPSEEFMAQLNTVLEMQVKEAVEKICSLFSETSAVLHLHLTRSQITHDNLKRKQKSVEKKPRTVSRTKPATKEIPNGQQTAPEDRISLVSQSWIEEEVVDLETTESLITTEHQSTMSGLIISKVEEEYNNLEYTIDNEKSSTNSAEENSSSSSEQVDVPSEMEGKEANAFTVSSYISEMKPEKKWISSQRRDSKLNCNICKRTFSKSIYLRAHQALHAAKKPHSHSQCDKSSTEKHTANALQEFHPGSYICCHCGKNFTQKRGLRKHERLHNKKGEGKDGEFFSRTHSLQKQHNCDTCGKSFTHLSNMHRHQRIHTGEKPFICGTCGKRFNQLDTLKSHERIHTGEKPFVCESCGTGFSQVRTLRFHEGQCMGQKGFSCVVCGVDSPCLSILNTHHKTHTWDTFLTCRVCGDSIASLKSLQNHQHQHDSSKFHSCSFCEKSFQTAGYLKIHERIHTGERPFCCSVCGKTFTQQNSLKNHQLSHTGERPFSCDVCVKCFSTAGNLRRHKLIHTGEKPYSCDVCKRSFNQLNTLKAHMYVHTGEKRYTCDKCGRSFGYQRNLYSHKCTFQ